MEITNTTCGTARKDQPCCHNSGIEYSNNEQTQLLSKSSSVDRIFTFFGMEPAGKPLHFSPFLLKAVLIASLGGTLFGYDLGVVSSALPSLSQTFNLSNSQQEDVVGLLYLGSAAGSVFGGFLCDYLGRKSGILLTDIIFIAGSMLLAFAHSVPALLIGRFVVGFAVSVSGIADVCYLTEVSPSNWRGALVSCNEACISLGFLVSYATGYVLTTLLSSEASWRVMFGLSGVIAAAQWSGMLFLPESPVWLQQKGRIMEARSALIRINDGIEQSSEDNGEYGGIALNSSGDDAKEIVETVNNIEDNNNDLSVWNSEVSLPPPPPSPFAQTLQNYNDINMTATKKQNSIGILRLYYRQIIITTVLASAQAFCGQGNILNYAPKIFADAGVSADSTLLSTLLLGTFKFIQTVVVILSVDRIGRRILLLSGILIICISLIVLIIAFSRESSSSTALALTGTVGVVIGYSTSFGPLTWLITSEIFPSEVRGRALGAQAIVTGLCSYLVSYTMLSAMDNYGETAPFILYFVASSLALLFSLVAIPDTGDRTPSEINSDLNTMFLWR